MPIGAAGRGPVGGGMGAVERVLDGPVSSAAKAVGDPTGVEVLVLAEQAPAKPGPIGLLQQLPCR
jgi:hypothetical protein